MRVFWNLDFAIFLSSEITSTLGPFCRAHKQPLYKIIFIYVLLFNKENEIPCWNRELVNDLGLWKSLDFACSIPTFIEQTQSNTIKCKKSIYCS